MLIRDERPGDIPLIRSVVYAAFLNHPHHAPGALPTEHKIVDELRNKNVLIISAVALVNDLVVGHVAYSPILIDGKPTKWLGLGPVSVHPDYQGQGIGTHLITTTLARLRLEQDGIVVLGNPDYYSRFGFRHDSRLELEGVPPEFFMSLHFAGTIPSGIVTYPPAFSVT
ncbi:N-acetyltransferase [bacterium]|nr:N-acetyltransferase [bacterium]